jgi:hypothetical protein
MELPFREQSSVRALTGQIYLYFYAAVHSASLYAAVLSGCVFTLPYRAAGAERIV